MHPHTCKAHRYVGDNMSMVGMLSPLEHPTQNTLTCREGYTLSSMVVKPNYRGYQVNFHCNTFNASVV